MIEAVARIRETRDYDSDRIVEQLAGEFEPVVFRGLVSDWPLVEKSHLPTAEVSRYLLAFYKDAPVTAFVSDSDIGGRLFYTENLENTNFKQTKTGLKELLSQIQEHEADSAPPTVYMGSTALDYCLPGFKNEHSLALGDVEATVRIWLGNRTRVAAHYDVLENVACVCAGRRRFTLFPPDQLPNLYVGPIDFTPAGQPVSLVDLNEPDFEQFPRFVEALKHAQTAELEPGDAIYIPSMWWHNIEGLESFNILINHWWRNSPAYMGAPGDALLHAILSIRDLPEDQRKAWRGIFDHYVFNTTDNSTQHIPEARKGVLGKLDEDAARRLRTLLRNKLNR
ncbi:MAG: cupin-like domain-containing protein [Woeseia sp.]|nr:cupin-like domain-containing protein [Woeseia sp.]